MATSFKQHVDTSKAPMDFVRLDATIEPDFSTIDLATRSVDFVMSTNKKDSYGEIVVQDWDLGAYSLNPVLLYGHNWFAKSAADTLPIGHMQNVAVVKGKLKGRAFLASAKANPLAEMVWNGLIEKSIRAGSVGFRTTEVTTKRVNDQDQVFLSGNILKEFSITPIGANSDVVALGDEEHAQESQEQQFRRLAARAKALDPQERGNHDRGDNMDPKEKELSDLRQRAENDAKELQLLREKATERVKADTERARADAERVEFDRAKSEADRKAADDETTRLKAEVEVFRALAKENREKAVTTECTALMGTKILPAQAESFKMLMLSEHSEVVACFRAFVEAGQDLKGITAPKIGTEESTGKNKGADDDVAPAAGLRVIAWAADKAKADQKEGVA